MIKTYFQKLAEKENGKFAYSDKDISIGMGVRSPSVIFQVKFQYKENKILIDNRTGTNYVGLVVCNLASHIRPLDFSLESRSPLSYLISRKKNLFKISCENKNFIHFLETNTALNELGEIGQRTKFHPIINCKTNNGRAILECKYHLEFEDWTQVLEPLIELYKNIIDEFEKGNGYLSNTQYRSIKN